MFRSQLSRTLIVSHSLLFITVPVVSHQGTRSVGPFSQELIDTDSSVKEQHKVLLNKNVSKFVKNYVHRNNRRLNRIKQKNTARFKMIDSVFTVYHLPVELKYLAVVESEMKATALSRVGARGPWQLMPSTARLLGLKVKRGQDERIHYVKSTKAAAKYLKDLYRGYGDWLLVLAAYNAGPAPVQRAIRKSGSKNFWKLQQYLPAETRGHVKKYIAVHYYFEGQGGVTTLTKAERLQYKKAMDALAKQ